MTIYSKFVKEVEQEKDDCDCLPPPLNYKPKNIFVFPGGGVSSVRFSLGVYKALHTAGLLVDENGELNRDNVFIGSSGGVIPGLLIANCINMGFTKQPNWFHKYVEIPISKMTPLTIIDAYVTSQIRSFLSEKLANCFLDDWSYTHFDAILKRLIPTEFIGKQGICFLSSYLADHFKFNYVKVVNGNTPYMTDNQKDTSQMTIVEQFKTIFQSCCTINGLSYTRYFQNHDAGTTINNYIVCISKYMDNPYIRNVFYYTLATYDIFSYETILLKNTLNYNARDIYEQNNFLIQSIESECLKRNKNFCLLCIPNKFNTLQKFNVALYNELQQRIYYTADFGFEERFLCAPLFRSNTLDFQRVVTLFGYYETLDILNQINKFNTEKKKQFNNIKSGYVNKLYFENKKVKEKEEGGNLFKLTSDEIVAVVLYIKNNSDMLKECFVNDCIEKSAVLLTEYLTMKQGGLEDAELFPVTNPKIFKKPEKYLDREYKRVSKNIVNIYFGY